MEELVFRIGKRRDETVCSAGELADAAVANNEPGKACPEIQDVHGRIFASIRPHHAIISESRAMRAQRHCRWCISIPDCNLVHRASLTGPLRNLQFVIPVSQWFTCPPA